MAEMHAPAMPAFNLFGPKFKADPYPTYARLRCEWPAYCRATPNASVWYITRYTDVAALLRDTQRFVKDIRNTLPPDKRDAAPRQPELIRLLTNHMLNLDAPDHTRLRSLVNKAFTSRMVERLEPRIEEIAHSLIDHFIRHSSHGQRSHGQHSHGHGTVDLIEEFSFPLSIIVIADLLGIPARDRNRFRAWSNALFSPTADEQRTQRKLIKSGPLMHDFIGYLRAVFEQRRSRPNGEGDDLITSLLQAEEAGDMLSEDELFSMILLLIVVGHETSVNLIGNGMLSLLRHPEQMRLLMDHPELLPGAVEEALRYDCPVERAPMRFAAVDVELHGQTIRRGDSVSLVLGSANRDETIFPDADTFDIRRTPNRHLAFGLGSHYCLGAPLARLEGRVAFSALLARLPELRLAVPPESLRWHTHPIMRGLRRLPVTWAR